jgi:crotonobetainyl-CoA:carnitine CoA-transferase CaiB-like acyl-CoA transferase
MSVNREGGGTPQRIGVLVIDVVTGLYAYQAIATALYRRAVRGGGRHIETSLMEAIGAVQAGKMIEFHLEGPQGQKAGVPVATFAAADGHLTINARRDKHFAALVEILGVPELAADPRFAETEARAAHEAALMPILVERVAVWRREELAARLEAADILTAPVNDYADYFADPHVRESGAVAWREHPELGEVPFPAIPGLGVPGPDGPPSPRLGQHGAEVLAELGFTAEDVAALAASGAVAGAG